MDLGSTLEHEPPRGVGARTLGRAAGPSTGSVVAILVSTTIVTYLFTWALVWRGSPSGGLRSILVAEPLQIAMWLSIVGALGWSAAAGLVKGSASSRKLVGLAALGVAAIVATGAGVAPIEARSISVLAVVAVLGALREEIAFRGFLLHGLSLRIGTPAAEVASSALFAAYHLPRYVHEGLEPGQMAPLLLVAFGVGAFLCRLRLETGSIWLPVMVHALWNVLVDVGHGMFPHGDLPGAYVVLHTIPFALGIVLVFFLTMRAAARTRRGALLVRLHGPAAAFGIDYEG